MTSDLVLHPRPTPLAAAVGVLMAALAKVLPWFVPIVVLVPVLLHVLVAALGGGPMDSSITIGVLHNAPMWFLAVMGAVLATEHLPVHVAHGMTRRLFAAALSCTMLAAAALMTFVLPIGLMLESLLFDALGWARDGLVGPLDAFGALMAVAFLRFAALASLGVLAAITYYRGGAWFGFVGPIVMAPFAFVLYLLRDASTWIAPPMRAVLLVATIVAVTAAAHALIRGATIRGKPA